MKNLFLKRNEKIFLLIKRKIRKRIPDVETIKSLRNGPLTRANGKNKIEYTRYLSIKIINYFGLI